MPTAIHILPRDRGHASARGNYFPSGSDFLSPSHSLAFSGGTWTLSGGSLSVDGVGGTLVGGPASATWADYDVTVVGDPLALDVVPDPLGAAAGPGGIDLETVAAGAPSDVDGFVVGTRNTGPNQSPALLVFLTDSLEELVFVHDPSADTPTTSQYIHQKDQGGSYEARLFYIDSASGPNWIIRRDELGSGPIEWEQADDGQATPFGDWVAVGAGLDGLELVTGGQIKQPKSYDVTPDSSGAPQAPGKIEL